MSILQFNLGFWPMCTFQSLFTKTDVYPRCFLASCIAGGRPGISHLAGQKPSLEAAGLLREIANYLDAHISNSELIASAIGVVSAIIDNVPLVAAAMGMYDLSSYPQDSQFWQLVAFCAGTGGSMLVIGSAAGVALMGMEKIDFFWYIRKASGFALAGYAAGIATYLATQNLHFSPTTVASIPFISGS